MSAKSESATGLASAAGVRLRGGAQRGIVERRISSDNNALLTCRARGWAEPMTVGAIDSAIDPTADRPQERFTVYRLTDSGWNAVQRTHDWIVRTVIVAALTLVATVVGIVIAVWISQS